MNKELIKNWNSVVKAKDKVFILGDFCINAPEEALEVIEQLNGRKFLVKGNHDRASWRYLELGFEEVYSYPILYAGKYILSHRPLDSCKYINLHGHVHSDPNYKTWDRKSACLSLERHNYTPVSLDEVENHF